MAVPAVGADTAIGGQLDRSEELPPQERDVIRRTYKRICQHYVTNNNTSTAPTVTIRTNGLSSELPTNFGSYYYGDFDQGYYNIPYIATNMAPDASDWDEIQMSASRLRIHSCGFKIKRLTCSQQVVNSVGSTTTVTNQFTQIPTVMLVKDIDNTLATNGTIADTTAVQPSDCSTVFTTPGFANKSFPHSFAAGALPKVRWLQPSGPASTFNAETSFDVLKGAKIKLLQTGDKYEYMWVNKQKQWMSPFLVTNDDNLTDETVRNTNFYNPSGTGSVTAAILDNLSTNVKRNMTDIPMAHFIRVPPLYTQVGPVTVSMEIWIEYSMTVEYVTGRYLTTRYIGGTDQSALPGNFLPLPEYRRTMLAFSAFNNPPPTKRGTKRPGDASGTSGPADDKRGRGPPPRGRDQVDGRGRSHHLIEDSDDE